MDYRKQTEQAYYDQQAAKRATSPSGALDDWGAAAIDEHLRAPYTRFQQLVCASARPGSIIVELGAGTAVHSIEPARAGATVLATDISGASLVLGEARARRAGANILLSVADAECLPVRDGSVDIVTSAGVLYCLDMCKLLPELTRVLSPTGRFIVVDSLDHNIVYRVNRLIGRLRGRRTRRATTHIPNMGTIALIRQHFADVSVEYFGVWTFTWPLARRLLGRAAALRLLGALEPPGWLKRYAFKIVVIASQPRRQ